jgi:hypothetical protein
MGGAVVGAAADVANAVVAVVVVVVDVIIVWHEGESGGGRRRCNRQLIADLVSLPLGAVSAVSTGEESWRQD